jgi:hypothetical protein
LLDSISRPASRNNTWSLVAWFWYGESYPTSDNGAEGTRDRIPPGHRYIGR